MEFSELIKQAEKVLGHRELSGSAEAGSVAAAILGANGKVYVGVCIDTACSLGFESGLVTTLGTIPETMLMAISCGAVFMGANTYIGNAPNFMVKAISDENGIRMPSFFGYLLWSLLFLGPVFLLDALIFFR